MLARVALWFSQPASPRGSSGLSHITSKEYPRSRPHPIPTHPPSSCKSQVPKSLTLLETIRGFPGLQVHTPAPRVAHDTLDDLCPHSLTQHTHALSLVSPSLCASPRQQGSEHTAQLLPLWSRGARRKDLEEVTSELKSEDAPELMGCGGREGTEHCQLRYPPGPAGEHRAGVQT